MPLHTDVDDRYWADYDGLQDVKHQLLRKYLDRWFPILSSWNGRVLYIDCNAGRGRHESGQEGSPILAIKTLLNHRSYSRMSSTEVRFVFFENNPENYEHLCSEIGSLGDMPANIKIQIYPDAWEEHLRQIVAGLRTQGGQLAPAFVFVDPFGFKLSIALLNELLDFPKCELFINFMYRFVNLAMCHKPPQTDNLDRLFGSSQWQQLVEISDYQRRAKEAVNCFSKQLHANYVTHMYMLGRNNLPKYVLIHAANHPRARQVMKDAMWAVMPDGRFMASERRNPGQLILIQPEPDLQPLRDRLWESFVGKRVTTEDLHKWLVEELYREPHLHQVLDEYRKKGFVTFNENFERVAYAKNPPDWIPARPPVRELSRRVLTIWNICATIHRDRLERRSHVARLSY